MWHDGLYTHNTRKCSLLDPVSCRVVCNNAGCQIRCLVAGCSLSATANGNR